MSVSLESVKARIAELEQMAVNSVNAYKAFEEELKMKLANHNALLGALQESKNYLSMVDSVSDAVAPESAVTKVLDAVETVADAVAEPAPAAEAVEAPAAE